MQEMQRIHYLCKRVRVSAACTTQEEQQQYRCLWWTHTSNTQCCSTGQLDCPLETTNLVTTSQPHTGARANGVLGTLLLEALRKKPLVRKNKWVLQSLQH